MKDEISVRVYYEDTDCGGVVYYANYLRYFERARTGYLESRGVGLRELVQKGIFFVVTEASVRYHAPGRYGDTLVIGTSIERLGPASITFGHRVLREGALLATGSVRLGCVGGDMKPLRMGRDIMDALSSGE